ncbi:GntR family transcriptional regulator [Burkholderia sp. PAMC 28687]|uniref:Pyruvate dehydrogenase complex repressor n=1 Tax=Caballeronia sordidicola TaxID=196367 RepID=A0A242M7C5_CABSO|nr:MULTISPECIES: FadR/GntR family transcriptional regulator [Burkholderiaceae]AMM15674.1 GntR family transcriptional regulator [Burkholderia sp. PAMC 28687]OTP67165.1 Transcriptional regulator, GntR family [Caballeronia sordidicola]
MLPKALTLTHQVAQQLTRDIGDGVYPVGTKLPSGKDLALRFGVSQSVIREVTERLRAHGLIDSRQGAGCTVTARTQSGGFQVPQAVGADRADLGAVYELRLDLEGASAALAAVRRTDADIKSLESILQSLADHLYTPEPAVELDIAFHVAIAHATHNRYYVDLLQYLNLQIRQAVQTARTHSLALERLPDAVHREHVRIFDAIRAGDALAARTAATSHLQKAAARLNLDITPRQQ